MDILKHDHKQNDLAETDLAGKQEPAGEEKKAGEDRIVLLTDGIFAIAVTLLVLDIKIPETIQGHDAFVAALTGEFISQTRSYIVTFVVLVSYWLSHRRLMSRVKHIDTFFLWLNLLFLAFVAFFPIATNISKYNQFPEAVSTYTLVLVGCGYSAALLWIYAITNNRLIAADIYTNKDKQRIIITSIITPTFFLASLLLLFIPHISPSNVFYSWLLLPIVYGIWRQKTLWSSKRSKEAKNDS